MARTAVRRGGRVPAAAPGETARAYRRGLLSGAGAVLAVALLTWAVVWTPLAESTEDRIRRESAARDQKQIVALTDTARDTVARVAPVLAAMAAGEAPDEAWEPALREAAAAYDDPPSGETATNVARGALAAATDLLVSATAAYPDDPERAAELRRLAVRMWSVGATQLDAVNIEAGNGHQHVFLDADGEGAFTPDGAPEGEGARDGEG